MILWAQQFLAKFMIVPAVFSFAVACCHPAVAPVIESTNSVQRSHVVSISHSSDLNLQSAHHCDNEKNAQTQSAVQAPVQKTSAVLVFGDSYLAAISFYQYPPLNPELVVRARVTGPPWSGKNLKGFLGVYRS